MTKELNIGDVVITPIFEETGVIVAEHRIQSATKVSPVNYRTKYTVRIMFRHKDSFNKWTEIKSEWEAVDLKKIIISDHMP